jgi:hypothetical protein
VNRNVGEVSVFSRILPIVALAGACSSPEPANRGHIVVAVTIDWEGAYLSPEGLDAIDNVRTELGDAPLTHFVSSAYFTKDHPDPTATKALTAAMRPGDELSVHLHAWRSLARASGVQPRVSPSFLTGTDQLMELEDGDLGFDTDLDVYDVGELRLLLRTSRRILESLPTPVSKTFRAGGYLGTPKVLQAIHDEGFVVDSSATDSRRLEEQKEGVLPGRVLELWPTVTTASQPFFVDVVGGHLLEMPITAITDYVTVAELVGIFEAADAHLRGDPRHDVFVVLGFHQETAHEFASRLVEALHTIRAREGIAKELVFVTMEHAADAARGQLAE